MPENLVGDGIRMNAVAPRFLFPAREDLRDLSGQILHPIGGTIVGG